MKGDNIYYKSEGEFRQRKNPFHGLSEMSHDLSGRNVLICESFWYFGTASPAIPASLRSVIKRGPKHKNNVSNPVIPQFLEWLRALPTGVTGEPSSVAT